MLTFSLNMQWDDTNDIWTINSMNFDDASTTPTFSIHSMNQAMGQILKIFGALDIPIQAQSIVVVPGTPSAE